MNAITFREATQDDAAALGALHVASWHETYTGLIPDEMLAELSIEKRTTMWSKALGNPEAFGNAGIFLAEDSGRVVGFGSCGQQRDTAFADMGFSGEIYAIYVLRSHQNLGVGRSLMTAMSRVLLSLGHAAMSLWVLRENTPARKFYEMLGGRVVGEKADERVNAALFEVAYGWHDLSGFGR